MSGTSIPQKTNVEPNNNSGMNFADRLMGKFATENKEATIAKEITDTDVESNNKLLSSDPTFFKSMANVPDLRKPLNKSANKSLNLARGLPLAQRLKRGGIPPINKSTPTIEEPVNTPLRESKGKRLSRRELEAMLDQFYETSDQPTPPSDDTPSLKDRRLKDGQIYHARKAGNRLVAKLAMVSSLALVLGFGVGLYSLSSQGADTAMGKRLNQAMANIGASISANMPTSLASIVSTRTPLQKSGKIVLDNNATRESARETLEKIVATNNLQSNAKPIKTASLVVADASGPVAVGIPLSLTLSAPVSNSFIEVKVTNVPRDAVLTAGKRQDDGVWVLKPQDLRRVQLVLSSQSASPLRLNIELVEAKTGELLTPPREIRVSVLPSRPIKVGHLSTRVSGGL